MVMIPYLIHFGNIRIDALPMPAKDRLEVTRLI
jgi:hypothetical protein